MPNPPKPTYNNKKIAGVKGKWWLVGGVGAAGFAYWYYSKAMSGSSSTPNTTSSDNAAGPPADPTTDPNAYGYDAGLADSYGGGGGYSGGGGSGGYGGGTYGAYDNELLSQVEAELANLTPGTTVIKQINTPPSDDKAWMNHAISVLEAHGYTHAQAKGAISAYLAGAELTPKEISTVQAAISLAGVPPTQAPAIRPVPHQRKKHDPPHHRKKHNRRKHHSSARVHGTNIGG